MAWTTLMTVIMRIPDPSIGSPSGSPVSAMWNDTGRSRCAHSRHSASKRASA